MTRFVVFVLVLLIIVVLVELIRRQRFNARRAATTSWPPPASDDPLRRAPAGWYPRPDGDAGQQYWDGEVWTDQRSA